MPSNLAGSAIRAIQSAFLDILFLRLLPLPLVLGAYGKEAESPTYQIMAMVAWALVLLGICCGWLLGFFAIRYNQVNPALLRRRQDAPQNAFQVWIGYPRFGFNPPRSLRRLVDVLGQSRTSIFRIPDELWALVGLLGAAAFFVVMLSPGLAGRVSPFLATIEARRTCLWSCTIALAAMMVRVWAIEARGRLKVDPDVGGWTTPAG